MTPILLRERRLGRGKSPLVMLVCPGIFEGLAYAYTLAERIVADDVPDSPTRAWLDAWDVDVLSIVPPGYDRGDSVPSNDAYGERLWRALWEIERRRDDGARVVVLFHSWGALAGATLWSEDALPFRRPDVAILETPAFSDVVSRAANLGGVGLRLPGAAYLSRVLYPMALARTLYRSSLPAARGLAAALPDRLTTPEVAAASVRAVSVGPRLVDDPRLVRAGEQVVVVLGGRDQAVVTAKVIALLELLCERDSSYRRLFVEIGAEATHYPLIETSQLLASLVSRAFLGLYAQPRSGSEVSHV